MDSGLKRNLLFGCLIIAASICVAAAGWFIYYKMQFNLYKDAANGFTVKYPTTWKMIPQPDIGIAVVFQSPKETALDVFQENINLSVQVVPEHLASLKTFSGTITKQMKAVFQSNIKIIEDVDFIIGGRTGHKMVFETPEPQALKSVIAWVIKKDKAFVITYMGRLEKYPLWKTQIDEVVFSFQFL